MKAIIKNGIIDGIYEIVPEGMTGEIVDIPDYNPQAQYTYVHGEIQAVGVISSTPEIAPLSEEELSKKEKQDRFRQ